jgi:uncharacterized protein (TIGR00255 family)
VHEALQWCRQVATGEALDETALEAARKAVAALRDARAREGERLAAVLLDRVAQLRELAAHAAPLLPAVVQRQQQRFVERWNEALELVGAAQSTPREALQERALNEAAAFAVRIDAGGEIGKRLEFLIQELHREANTLGAKSAALELTNISVEMKVLIEQLREQVQNIE